VKLKGVSGLRVSISPDGRFLKVKVRGERRFVSEIPFRDRWRRRSFRTLRRVLEDLGFKDLRMETLERGVEIMYEADGEPCTREVPLRDTVLSACPPPSPMLPKKRLRNGCRLRFVYSGKGHFEVSIPAHVDDDEARACKRIIEHWIVPLYRVRWPSLQKRSTGIAGFRTDEKSGTVECRVEDSEVKTVEEEKPRVQEKMVHEEPRKPPSIPCPAPPRTETQPLVQSSAKLEERKVSIEDVKREIAGYQPATFREKAAYERYRQTLERPWARGREDEIHRLFYSLIKGRRSREDFKRFYRQLYQLTPEWLRAVQPIKRRRGFRKFDRRG